MKTTHRWLEELCPAGLSPDRTADVLMRAGFEVADIEEHHDDIVFELEITANHADWLGAIGIAREIAAATGVPASLPEVELREEGPDISELTALDVEDGELCPLYIARVITGVKVTESPDWLKRRLELIGLRPVNAPVDVTNYLMYETGQPLHVFDMNKLAERRIVVRKARKGEKMTAINGKEVVLEEWMPVIADAERPVAIAGVMGGLDSEIGPDTVDVFIECAAFHGPTIRRTARRTGIFTDSSARFERGTDLENADYVSRRCAAMILEFCGGEAARGSLEFRAAPPERREVSIRPARVERVLGIRVEPERIEAVLSNLGFTKTGGDREKMTFIVPSWRKDVAREEDLIEEVARIEGYDRIPTEIRLTAGGEPAPARYEARMSLRRILAGLGLDEACCDPFVKPEHAVEFSFRPGAKAVSLINPPRSDMNAMRTSLVPGLLKALKGNRDRNVEGAALFEIERAYFEAGEGLPDEVELVGLLMEEGYPAAKGVLEAALAAFLPRSTVEFVPSGHRHAAEGRCADVVIDGERAGYLAEVSARHADMFDLKVRPAVAELEADKLYARCRLPLRSFDDGRIPRFPSVERDFAFVLDESVLWRDVERTVRRSCEGAPLEELRFFDIYRGKQIPAGKKSIAFRLVFRAPDRTLTEEAVAPVAERVVREMKNSLGAELRG